MRLPSYPNRENKKGWISNGYRFLSTPDRGEIAEHRYLMEKYIGRQLDEDEIVHHRNRNKKDNRFENLEIIARGNHTSIHRARKLPCVRCGSLEGRGAFGLCGRHYAQTKRYIEANKIKLPQTFTPKCTVFMGVALAMENDEVLLRIGSLYGS